MSKSEQTGKPEKENKEPDYKRQFGGMNLLHRKYWSFRWMPEKMGGVTLFHM